MCDLKAALFRHQGPKENTQDVLNAGSSSSVVRVGFAMARPSDDEGFVRATLVGDEVS